MMVVPSGVMHFLLSGLVFWVFRTNVTAGFGIVTEDFGPS